MDDEQTVGGKERETDGTWWNYNPHLHQDYKYQLAVLKELEFQRMWAIEFMSKVKVAFRDLGRRLGSLKITMREPRWDLSSDLEYQISLIQKSLGKLQAGKTKAQYERDNNIEKMRGQLATN
jgi:hypothetical protein